VKPVNGSAAPNINIDFVRRIRGVVESDFLGPDRKAAEPVCSKCHGNRDVRRIAAPR
jgi:hypothetical protein